MNQTNGKVPIQYGGMEIHEALKIGKCSAKFVNITDRTAAAIPNGAVTNAPQNTAKRVFSNDPVPPKKWQIVASTIAKTYIAPVRKTIESKNSAPISDEIKLTPAEFGTITAFIVQDRKKARFDSIRRLSRYISLGL